MNKSAYLAAMDITTWRVRDTKVRAYQVVLDEDELARLEQERSGNNAGVMQTLIAAVLRQIDINVDDCEFTAAPRSARPIVWDLRRVKVRPRSAWLVSEPLANLLTSSGAKRDLWGQICQWLEQQASA
ncbi:DNA polymerase III subunit psi [Shewanella acanthi]|uniref:DNA polymerase III subunit psi n=1 Tax=Shewanella acanthi TaxID=2864212 RepID=UPI001C657A32|nr:DNA polymerase III subunit psi [Shewanella acanthi]QYJ79634.1 DNA polymerase III subunit psi [Shewanella acanthi]